MMKSKTENTNLAEKFILAAIIGLIPIIAGLTVGTIAVLAEADDAKNGHHDGFSAPIIVAPASMTP